MSWCCFQAQTGFQLCPFLSLELITISQRQPSTQVIYVKYDTIKKDHFNYATLRTTVSIQKHDVCSLEQLCRNNNNDNNNNQLFLRQGPLEYTVTEMSLFPALPALSQMQTRRGHMTHAGPIMPIPGNLKFK